MAYRMSSPLTVFLFSWWHFSDAAMGQPLSLGAMRLCLGPGGMGQHVPSLVIKEINSLTHSCMHSLASLAIFAFSGRAFFMMRATGAKLRMLASCPSWRSAALEADDEVEARGASGDLDGES